MKAHNRVWEDKDFGFDERRAWVALRLLGLGGGGVVFSEQGLPLWRTISCQLKSSPSPFSWA